MYTTISKFLFAAVLILAGGLNLTGPVLANAPDANGCCQFDFSDSSWSFSGKTDGTVLDKVEGVEGAVLQIKANGDSSNAWIYRDFPFDRLRNASKQGLGLFRFKARTLGSGSGGMTGPDFCNKDFSFTPEWKTYSIIFPINSNLTTGTLRLGQWHAKATFQFAEAEILPVCATFGDCQLGSGEGYDPAEGRFRFNSAFDTLGGSYCSALKSWRCGFNSNRWCFGGSSEVVYQFNAPEQGTFFGGELEYTVGYFIHGQLKGQYSLDGQNWTDFASQESSGTANAMLPELKAPSVWIRFKAAEKTNLQMDRFSFTGFTTAQAAQAARDKASATGSESKENLPPGTVTEVVSRSGKTLFWELVRGDGGFPLDFAFELPTDKPGEQTYETEINWKDADGADKSSVVRCTYYVPDYYREDYGYRLDPNAISIQGACGAPIWWTESTYKVAPKRRAPTLDGKVGAKLNALEYLNCGQSASASPSQAMRLAAAGNDYESAQLVVRPEVDTTVELLEIADFVGPNGAKIAKENIEARKVFYHFVEHPTDKTGVRDWWPDALLPIDKPFEAQAGQNSPIWLTVYVPKGTPAGEYQSAVTIKLTAKSGTSQPQTAIVPVRLKVWGFALPESNTVQTAFGFSPGTAWRYHGVQSEEDKRKVVDLYFQLLGKYRISPYNPVPMDPFSVKFVVDKDNPANSRAEIDFSRFDEAFANALKQYHFTGFQLHLQGMGGGTFHERWAPSIQGFKEGTPEFTAMFKSQVEQIQNHFKEKGWLDKCYVYWFDEPDTKDYEFVRDGMNRIKKYAPEIPTMLTEEPSEATIDTEDLGKIDIWCPVTPNYNHELAEKFKAKGAKFWTYVCCWPHDPYCTEFTDHSAVELRTWLWQTWKYNTHGILIWASNYWTSGTAFPDPKHPQDPYLDPMCYVSGYSTPAGTKRFWGNGDGRLYYPPLTCAQPSSEPNFEQPVPSIRLAMLREGIEDFETLQVLKSKIQSAKNLTVEQRAKYEALLAVPSEITEDLTTFNFSPQPIYQRRAKIAAALEEISKSTPSDLTK